MKRHPVHFFKEKTRFLLIVVSVLLVSVSIYAIAGMSGCYAVSDRSPIEGSQGFRIWTGDALKSFEHFDRKVCIPEGWESVGAIEIGEGWARFESGKTGVIFQSEAFVSHTVKPGGTGYEITVVNPLAISETMEKQFDAIIVNAFERISKLYADSDGNTKSHTVFITAGLAGNTLDDGTRVYPDPGLDVTYLVRTPESSRAEELFIHAIMHLYNRHRTDLTEYEKTQTPFTSEEWQELEATWSETAFNESRIDRKNRISYLLNVHYAVGTRNFSLIKEPPFDDRKTFENIKPTIMVKQGAQSLDYQYGHYVLAPLSMVAIDALLRRDVKGMSLEKLLTDVHKGKINNLFTELETLLPKDDFAQVQSWVKGETLIPSELIYSALSTY
jgi:hypothetical protein